MLVNLKKTLYDYNDIQYLQIKLKIVIYQETVQESQWRLKFMLNLYSKTLQRGFPPLSKLDGEVLKNPSVGHTSKMFKFLIVYNCFLSQEIRCNLKCILTWCSDKVRLGWSSYMHTWCICRHSGCRNSHGAAHSSDRKIKHTVSLYKKPSLQVLKWLRRCWKLSAAHN